MCSVKCLNSGAERDTIEKVCLQSSELISCEWCSVRKLPVLFFQTTLEECVRLRTQLNMTKEEGGQWYDCSGDRKYNTTHPSLCTPAAISCLFFLSKANGNWTQNSLTLSDSKDGYQWGCRSTTSLTDAAYWSSTVMVLLLVVYVIVIYFIQLLLRVCVSESLVFFLSVLIIKATCYCVIYRLNYQ